MEEKKPRKVSPTQQLADWFWLTILGRDPTDRYINPDFRQLLSQSKYMLVTIRPPMEMEVIKRAVLLMMERGEIPSSPNLVYLKNEPMTGKSWYELAKNPILLAPPIYETLRLKEFLSTFDPTNPVLGTL